MTNLTSFDNLFNALARRSVGFDTLPQFSRPMASYPPYDIIKVDDSTTEIHVALAGYESKDIKIFHKHGELQVTSDGSTITTSEGVQYQGIAKRGFNITFALSSGQSVDAAAFNNGLLTIRILRAVEDHHRIPIEDSLPQLETTSHSTSDKVVDVSDWEKTG